MFRLNVNVIHRHIPGMILSRCWVFTLVLIAFSGCDLFPQRNEEANGQLVSKLISELELLESRGLFKKDAVNFAIINRYGTSYGGSRALEGFNTDGSSISLDEMVEHCINSTGTTEETSVIPCLRESYIAAEQPRFSHAGILYKIPGQDWSVRQSLRSTKTGKHFQWFGSLEQFVDIPLIERRIEVLIPTHEIQSRMSRAILIEGAGSDLIDPDYNLVAKPFQTEEQMSNQFVLEIMASVLQPLGQPISRENAQAYLAEKNYRPSIILLGGVRSFAKWDNLIPTMNLKDQPLVRKYEIGEFISVMSVRKFLESEGVVAGKIEASL